MCDIRLDILLKNKYGFSRTKAKELIEGQLVKVDDKTASKGSLKVAENAKIEILESVVLKYVSRGGFKLEKAINSFGINLDNKVCMDIGASTGGFTDCMLQFGAKKVYAVDVGHSQLADSLNSDSRVISMENTNIKDVKDINEDIDFISIDISFISLEKIFYKVRELLCDSGECVVLIKPQFEVGKANINKSGIVKEPKLHKMAINNVIASARDNNLYACKIDFSPIKGGNGNIEYLLYLKGQAEVINKNIVDECVKLAHNSL